MFSIVSGCVSGASCKLLLLVRVPGLKFCSNALCLNNGSNWFLFSREIEGVYITLVGPS